MKVSLGIIFAVIISSVIVPSFAQESDSERISSEEYSKLIDRLTELENQNYIQNDFHTWAITIGSIATAVALIFLGFETMSVRKERNATLRAWITEVADAGILQRRFFGENGFVAKEEEFKKMSDTEKQNWKIHSVEWKITAKNYGRIPATIRTRTKVVIDRIPERSELDTVYSSPYVIMPDSKHQYLFTVSAEESDALVTNRLACLMYESSYYSEGSNKERKYGFIAFFTPGTYKTIDTWNENTLNEPRTKDVIDKINRFSENDY